MAKLRPSTKGKITKLFLQEWSVRAIKAAVIGEFPKITPSRIRTVIRKHLIGKADDLWSKAIKQVGRCEIGGKTEALESHHLIRRENLLFRWDLSNGICLSSWHHTLGNDIAAHGSTDVTDRFAEWMRVNRLGQWKWFLKNRDVKNKAKVTCEDLQKICSDLEQVICKGE